MFSKFNIKTLVIVFAVLLAVVVASELFDSGKSRNFRKVISELVPEEVTKLEVTPRGATESYTIERVGDDWQIVTAAGSFVADPNAATSMLETLKLLKPERVVGTKESKWQSLELVDSLASRVRAFAGKKVLTDLMVGKFDYSQPTDPRQQQGKMTSYVRLTNEPESYAVDGFMSMTFNRKPEELRNRSLTSVNKTDITRIQFNYGNETFVLEKQNENWLAGGVMADSAQVADYLGTVARLNSSEFAEAPKTGTPSQSIVLEGNNFSAVQLDAYADAMGVVIGSSANKGTWFTDANDLFNRVFVSKEQFLAVKIVE